MQMHAEIMRNYAEIMQNYVQINKLCTNMPVIQNNAQIKHKLSEIIPKSRRYYANYANIMQIMQILCRNYAELEIQVMQILC